MEQQSRSPYDTPTHARLLDLIQRLHVGVDRTCGNIPVGGVSCDPEDVRPGDLFVALSRRTPGSIAAAVGRGAVAVVVEQGPDRDPGVPVVLVPDAIRALGHLAARFFDSPARAVRTCAVGGSIERDTVATLAREGLDAAGISSGHVADADGMAPGSHRLQARLRRMRDEGLSACVVEAAAHDVEAGRFEGLAFDSAVFTGLSRRPRRFQGTYDQYLDAQLDLFRGLPSSAVAALVQDDPVSELIAGETGARVVTYGLDRGADVRARICRMDLQGFALDIRSPVGTLSVRSELVGCQHLTSVLGALTLGLTLGAELDAVARGLARIRVIPQRLEPLAVPSGFRVFLDDAADPVSLGRVLSSIRPLVPGRLLSVVGVPDTDPAQRGEVGRVAERYSNGIIVTEGADRGDGPMAAIRDVMRGLDRPAGALLEPSRRRAVATALDLAKPGDVVLILTQGDGSDERRHVRDWFLADLEAEARTGGFAEP